MDVPPAITNSCPGHATGIPGLLITQLLQYLLAAQCELGNPNDYPTDYGDSLFGHEHFDFIVVGAGKAKLVVYPYLKQNRKLKLSDNFRFGRRSHSEPTNGHRRLESFTIGSW